MKVSFQPRVLSIGKSGFWISQKNTKSVFGFRWAEIHFQEGFGWTMGNPKSGFPNWKHPQCPVSNLLLSLSYLHISMCRCWRGVLKNRCHWHTCCTRGRKSCWGHGRHASWISVFRSQAQTGSKWSYFTMVIITVVKIFFSILSWHSKSPSCTVLPDRFRFW